MIVGTVPCGRDARDLHRAVQRRADQAACAHVQYLGMSWWTLEPELEDEVTATIPAETLAEVAARLRARQ